VAYVPKINRYLENEILSRPREWLVPLLYEHAVASLRRASVRLEGGDVGAMVTEGQRAVAIIGELLSTLDMEKGGAVAVQLDSLYRFLLTELMDIQWKKDRRRLLRVVAVLEDLQQAWVAAAEQVAPRGGARPSIAVAG
jgi:flagellar protein FliS